MPIYDYRCTACGHQSDLLCRADDPSCQDCPACGQPSFQRQLSAAGFQLKGSGWYVTDFKNNGKPKSGTAPTASDSKETGKTDDTSAAESKPGNTAESSVSPVRSTEASTAATGCCGGCSTHTH